ncbi:MAG: acyl-CoA dehydrogenase family protein [Stellaceae bacterium]
MNLEPSPRQRELIALARTLARERFAPRADRHDREASFPFDDYADLRAAGLLSLCVPERYGGLGADYETYCLVAEQLAQGNASTALTFNMHCLTMLMMGPLADGMPMPAAVRERHERLRAAKFRAVVENGVFYGQPHSEPVEEGETDTALSVGGRRFGTTARKVDGGYIVNGRKFFVSLGGCAPYYATPAIRPGEESWIERTLYLQIPKDAPGVSFSGDWDPMGMRATVSRDMVLRDVFVPDEAEVLPPGLFGALYNAFPHLFLSFSATFLGLMQAACDGALAYLSGEMAGAPGLHTGIAAKGPAIAEMLFAVEAARALYYRAISEARVDAPPEAVQRARAAHVTVQRAVVGVTQEAIRICGGRAFLKRYPLERYARDARAAALMRPWTQEVATQQAWEAALDLDGRGGTASSQPDLQRGPGVRDDGNR